jgi:hypothetical protein
MTLYVHRMFFDRGVVFMPSSGKVLLSFHGEDAPPVDLTDDFALLLEAGLLLLDEHSGVAPGDTPGDTPEVSIRSSLVEVATLEVPDRMRVYRDGRRLSHDEVAAAVELTMRSALRAALASH